MRFLVWVTPRHRITDVVMGRIDRLPEDAQEFVAEAPSIGAVEQYVRLTMKLVVGEQFIVIPALEDPEYVDERHAG